MDFCCGGAFCTVLVVVYAALLGTGWGDQYETFGFDIHHRFSDTVKRILDPYGLPEIGSKEYYSAMAYRDRVFRGRRLASSVHSTPLVFSGGNQTLQISSLGHLYYANISIGTPSLWFLVALDTGSDLFWLPCDCSSCVRGMKTGSGDKIDFNIYSPNTSSTSIKVACNSTICGQRRRCSVARNACAYQVAYLSNNTSSSGILVEDVLHLSTNSLSKVGAHITLGCGIVQTGSFLDRAAPNGLFGLGLDNISVPSILASKGLAANSFSMCFGFDGIGRIIFGDKGSSEQGETPFYPDDSRPTYNMSMVHVSVGDNATDISFPAIFDSGTSFTYLNDPAYTVMSESFNSQVQEKRFDADPEIPFEFCYHLSSANQYDFKSPNVTLIMKGGDQYFVNDPVVVISLEDGGYIYCLGVVRSEDINIIGQNFMTGYSIVFDREKMVLGWKASDCYGSKDSNTIPVNPGSGSNTATPPGIVGPEATSRNGSNSSFSSPQPSTGNHLTTLTSFMFILLTASNCLIFFPFGELLHALMAYL